MTQKEMFVRFVLSRNHPDTGVEEGIFDAAYELRDSEGISKNDADNLRAILDWFGDNLETPNRFSRTKSKGYYRRATKGVSWFKPTAEEHITKLWILKGILEDNGYHVAFIKSARPGYVVYEDEHQVVSEPFRQQK